METVQSADGTTIAFDRSGSGPTLVIVVGAFCDRFSSKGLSSLLAPHFTVYEYDRRGRGMSGDRSAYAIEREIEDLDALIERAGGSALVYGHSSGAVLALESAARGVGITRLAAYEPPFTAADDEPEGSFEVLEQVRGALAGGNPDRAAILFLQGTGTPPAMVSMIQNGPGWAGMRELAHTLVYDLILANGGAAPVERLANISAPTLVIQGGDSPPWARHASDQVAGSVPDAQQLTLAGQTHAAADEILAPVLLDFFGS